jgi:hypothetical protein
MSGGRRTDSDERYILDLCDRVLGVEGWRQHRFDFLRGDVGPRGGKGQRLPVDAYYPSLNLVIEYLERQHSEKVPHFDKRKTVSGMPRGEQRKKYDALRETRLAEKHINLVKLDYRDFEHDSRKRLRRDIAADEAALRQKLASYQMRVMAEKPLDAKVREWLASSGYPLEMQVAEAFRKAGFQISQGIYYPDSGGPRELDVLAQEIHHTRWALLRIAFFIECKASRDKPWIVFASERDTFSHYDPRDLMHWGPANKKGTIVRHLLAEFANVAKFPLFNSREIPAYGVVQARLGKSPGEDKGGDQSYAATMQVCTAALALTRHDDRQDAPAALVNRYTTIGFPVIVVDAPLYRTKLANGQLVLERVSRYLHAVRHPAIGDATFVTIVTQDNLPTFAQEAREATGAMANWCRENADTVGQALSGSRGPDASEQ